jgi:hypothetical protein
MHQSVPEFKASLWHWIEQINEKEPAVDNPKTGVIDENQDNLMNITFGLSDYGKINFMMKMADLYHQKKKLENQMKFDQDKAQKCTKLINEINLKGKKIMTDMENYVKTNKSRGVVAFA